MVKAQAQQLSPPLTPSTTSLATTTTDSIIKTPPSSLLPPNAALMVNMLQHKMPPSLFPYFHLNLQMFAAQQQQKLQNEMESEATAVEMSENVLECPKSEQKKKKRKGKAFKFDEKLQQQHSDEEPNMMENVEALNNRVTSSAPIVESSEKPEEYECKFCGIIFKDNVLFSLHIGYHSLGDDPFKCNMCGMRTEDKIQFFLHIAKFPHS